MLRSATTILVDDANADEKLIRCHDASINAGARAMSASSIGAESYFVFLGLAGRKYQEHNGGIPLYRNSNADNSCSLCFQNAHGVSPVSDELTHEPCLTAEDAAAVKSTRCSRKFTFSL